MEVERIKKLVVAGKTYDKISEILKNENPENIRGLSERSVRRFCKEYQIDKQSLFGKNQLDEVVRKEVSEVGKSYGRKMMTGVLQSKGINVCEVKVGQSLKRLDPVSQRKREETAGRSLNPKCYSADYFGHKVHLDQNEKLVMFGVTHVMARDGYSGMIVAISTMPIKNNLIIYDEIYRNFTLKFGLWDQVRVDRGKEFLLFCHIQEYLRDRRRNTSIDPFKSTKSTDNNIIERMWVEVNSRVNYPIKSALNHFVQEGKIDMTSERTKFAVSWVSCCVSNVGLQRFADAWNHHSVPKKGRPIDLMRSNAKAVQIESLMNKEEAADHYRNINNGHLTLFKNFGVDILDGFPDLQRRREDEILTKCSFNNIFYDIQNGKNEKFIFCIQHFIRVSNALFVENIGIM